MPHECTDCGAIYEDGSTQMLDGCDDCGGTTFLFTKESPADGSSHGDAAPPSTGETAAATPAETAEGVDGSEAATGTVDAGEGPSVEDPAQTSARSGIIEAEQADDDDADGGVETERADTAGAGDPPDDGPPTVSGGDAADGETVTPDTDEIREALMAQFESIKIVEPGSYELNLMNLYDRDEKIIALQEDGRYQVSLPSALDD
jgi:hypothetical protein